MKYQYFCTVLVVQLLFCNKENPGPQLSEKPIQQPPRVETRPPALGAYTSTTKALNVREFPVRTARVISVIPQGDRFDVGGSTFEYEEIDGIKGAWVTIVYKGQHGYVFEGYIRKIQLSPEETRRIYTDGTGLTETNGIIEGTFSYPSEGSPGSLEACAENLVTKKLYCTKEKFPNLDRKKYRYSRIFRLSVPEGTYHVYEHDPYNPSFRGYYNENVLCGLTVHCKSKKKIPVIVKANTITDNILPHDFF